MRHNQGVYVFGVFLLSQFLHIFLRALATRQSRLNGVKSLAQYIDHYGLAISCRLVAAFALLLLWMQNPQVLTEYANRHQWIIDHLGRVNLTLNAGTAFVFGYFIDSLLDMLPVVFPWLRPWLGKEVPPLDCRADIPKAEAA